ncbi:hypothetical protein HY407_01005 [Candidatus Gottesmanbacteria bacterium]|nr:hypothetical protein [Candidatus Gottesmanbacteria bacterium]
MDFQPAQPPIPDVPLKAPSNFFNRTLFICITALFVGFMLGIITWSILPFGKTEITTSSPLPISKINESKLPISLELLTNPIVYEWRGSVRGKITNKDESTFTLTDDNGNSIRITNQAPNRGVFKTIFSNKGEKMGKPILLKDIPIGTKLEGDFFIFRDDPNTPVGSFFLLE